MVNKKRNAVITEHQYSNFRFGSSTI